MDKVSMSYLFSFSRYQMKCSAGNNGSPMVIDHRDLIHDPPKSFYYDQDDHWVFSRFKNVLILFRFYTIQLKWLICITKLFHTPNSCFMLQSKYGYQVFPCVFLLKQNYITFSVYAYNFLLLWSHLWVISHMQGIIQTKMEVRIQFWASNLGLSSKYD